jgi:hypothetical protein
MYFQDKLIESTQELRARAATLGKAALVSARERAGVAVSRVEKRVVALKSSLITLGVAGRELEKVARRHGATFVKQNATIAQAARKDVTSLALSAFDAIAKKRAATVAKQTRKPVARKSAARKTASRSRAKAA